MHGSYACREGNCGNRVSVTAHHRGSGDNQSYVFAGKAGAEVDRIVESRGNDVLADFEDISVAKLPVCRRGDGSGIFGGNVSHAWGAGGTRERIWAYGISVCQFFCGGVRGDWAFAGVHVCRDLWGGEDDSTGVCEGTGKRIRAWIDGGIFVRKCPVHSLKTHISFHSLEK